MGCSDVLIAVPFELWKWHQIHSIESVIRRIVKTSEVRLCNGICVDLFKLSDGVVPRSVDQCGTEKQRGNRK